jgi:carbon-monoxide dehydrogenase medium subunit
MSSRILSDFDLLIPDSVEQALALLDEHKSNIKIVAGGSDMLIGFKFGIETPYAMSITTLPNLDYLDFSAESGLKIGALTTVAQLLESPEVKEFYPALWQAAKIFATPQIKNTATVLGNLLRASPAGDCSGASYAIGGEVLVKSVNGERTIDLDQFWVAYGKTALEDNELALELRLPLPAQHSAFKRLTRVNEDLAKLNVAASLNLDGNICRTARLTMGCVGPTLLRLPKCEQLLEGADLTDGLNEELYQKLCETVQDEIQPIDDKRSTAAYRRQVAGVFLKRTILAAAGKE